LRNHEYENSLIKTKPSKPKRKLISSGELLCFVNFILGGDYQIDPKPYL